MPDVEIGHCIACHEKLRDLNHYNDWKKVHEQTPGHQVERIRVT